MKVSRLFGGKDDHAPLSSMFDVQWLAASLEGKSMRVIVSLPSKCGRHCRRTLLPDVHVRCTWAAIPAISPAGGSTTYRLGVGTSREGWPQCTARTRSWGGQLGPAGGGAGGVLGRWGRVVASVADGQRGGRGGSQPQPQPHPCGRCVTHPLQGTQPCTAHCTRHGPTPPRHAAELTDGRACAWWPRHRRAWAAAGEEEAARLRLRLQLQLLLMARVQRTCCWGYSPPGGWCWCMVGVRVRGVTCAALPEGACRGRAHGRSGGGRRRERWAVRGGGGRAVGAAAAAVGPGRRAVAAAEPEGAGAPQARLRLGLGASVAGKVVTITQRCLTKGPR